MKRINKNDEIKATATGKNGILTTLYDSGFSTIKEIENALVRKIPHYSGTEINITITNINKQEAKNYTVKTNQ